MHVKICGVTRLEDAEAAVSAGAWAIGLNHHPESPRRVDGEVAAAIGATLRRRCEVVGVFVNAPLYEIDRAVADEHLSLVQLHGDEGPSFCTEVARRTGAKVMKAIRVGGSADVQGARRFHTHLHLFDAHRRGIAGGTGESFEWELIADRRTDVPFLLAGGLDPGNVAEAIAIARPWGVDVASGVESEPGIKDYGKVAAFIDAAQRASASSSTGRVATA